MKRLISAIVVVAIVMAAGCSLNKQFVNAVDDSWSVIGPEYVDLVQESDKFDDTDKEIRTFHAKALTDMINEAKK
jgi:ABC-type molybdate transport system substrate-binding protein